MIVNYNELPHKKGIGSNENKEVIDWNNINNNKIRFTINDEQDSFIINKFYKRYLYITYKDKQYKVSDYVFKNGDLEKIFFPSSVYKYKVGEIVSTKTGQIKIIEQLKHDKRNEKAYKYECLKDGNIDIVTESNLIKKSGCNVCSNKKVSKGINDIATTNPYSLNSFVNIKDAYTHTKYSSEYIKFQCPICNYKKSMKIYHFFDEGLNVKFVLMDFLTLKKLCLIYLKKLESILCINMEEIVLYGV